MTPSPDPLFRNGLENYRKTAPASVWDRVEAGLDRKRRKSVWLKVAAGLFLLIATLTVFWQYDPTDTSVAAISKESTLVTLKTDTIVSVAQEAAKPSLRESSVVSREVRAMGNSQHSHGNSIVERSRNNHADVVHEDLPVVERSRNEPLKTSRQSAFGRESSVVSREVVDYPQETQQISIAKTDHLLETPASDIQIENSTEELVIDVAAAQKSTIITYSSEEVNEKFLKKELTAEATPAKKNTSGLQKVIDKALDLTNEGTVYCELREKKNEWLSFNMLSNKTEANK